MIPFQQKQILGTVRHSIFAIINASSCSKATETRHVFNCQDFNRRGIKTGVIHDVKTTVAQLKENVEMISNIKDLSKNGLTERLEMPTELLQRLATLTKQRSNSQLEDLKLKYVRDSDNARKFPRDTHDSPVGWTTSHVAQIPTYSYGPSETLAYLAYEIDANYATLYNAFRQLRNKDQDFQPSTMIDFGAGPGTASWVAKEFFNDSIQKYQIVEPSQAMTDAAQVLMEDFNGFSIRRSLDELRSEVLLNIKYDFIVMNYVLSEVTNDFERVKIMSVLWELLSENGYLVIVDRGSPWGSHQVRSARQFILDSVNDSEDFSVRVVAPCPHNEKCPASKGTWCHFVQRSPVVLRPRDGTPRRWHGQKGSKFSYVVMKKGSLLSTSEAETNASLKASVARMIRGPLLTKRNVILDLCTPQGVIERRTVTKGTSLREVYRASRKAHWGAEWPNDPNTYREERKS
uniref:Uncharacterized protein AlNc14C65G4640 n=1 Tax=Albugo laibachii Nc14 TaxID=890382 RepID=F0WDC0_9STRA|nr:conserved hypothetical protein [Albugo laibachii Nc14]|eukprot:CCA19192.1 conserved hypothetical protein [Albugo laibachii Nc14]